MLTHTGVAPGTTAGACGGLGNAADAVDHSAGTHHSSNSGRNRSNDLAGDAAIVSLSSGGSGLGSRCRGSFLFFRGIKHGIERRIVIHLHLLIYFHIFASRFDIGYQLVNGR